MRLMRFLRAVCHPITEHKVTKAKSAHRKEHPECAVCGLLRDISIGHKNNVHHEEPVHVNPSRACDPTNLITLCRTHHFVVGHLKSWKKWNANVRTTIRVLREVFIVFVDEQSKETYSYNPRNKELEELYSLIHETLRLVDKS